MRAFCLDFEHRAVVEAGIPEPRQPGPGEVLLDIREVGVCATDRELTRFRFGEPPPGETLLALGHEALAQVAAVGPDVSHLRPGDWVVPMIRRACPGPCPACAQGRYDLCRTGGYLERGITRAHGYFTRQATDPAHVLVPVPAPLVDVAVLAEPLSVVEKAIESGLRAHPLEPRSACIVGAGPVGLLAAFSLLVRGFEVQVVSLEPEDHPRVQLLRRAGVPYRRTAPSAASDLVFEASGSNDAASAALEWLAPCGVFVLIGAPEPGLHLSGIRMIVDNLTVTGIVNAGRLHFDAAFAGLARIPRALLESMIERRPASSWRESLAAGSATPKIVHPIDTA